jgi:hypothetical protein
MLNTTYTLYVIVKSEVMISISVQQAKGIGTRKIFKLYQRALTIPA